MKRSALIAVAALICISKSAMAEDSGFYLGAGVASGKLSACDNTTSTCNNFTASSQDHTHLRLIGGYDFNKYFGIEAGVSGLGTYKVQNTNGSIIASAKSSAVTLAAKGGYVFPHGFSIFGKLGLASV
jgi:OOP family OmpA-OmpF porin